MLMEVDPPFQFEEYRVRVFGAEDASPWFVAREAADILGIVNSRNVVATLDADEKCSYGVKTPGGRQTVTLIRESGLYKMIFRSRKPTALRFQNWVCRVVLPEIRKRGMGMYEAQLAQVQRTLDHYVSAYSQLSVYMENLRQRENSQVVYIATNPAYALRNIYKVGSCMSEGHLKKRLSTYNSGRAPGDELYFTALFFCHNAVHLEARIKEMLRDFRCQQEKEMYALQYSTLVSFLQLLTQHYNREVDEFNRILKELVSTPPAAPPSTPEPTTPPPAPQLVAFDAWTDAVQEEWIAARLEEFAPADHVVRRKAFEAHVHALHPTIQVGKWSLWRALKRVAATTPQWILHFER